MGKYYDIHWKFQEILSILDTAQGLVYSIKTLEDKDRTSSKIFEAVEKIREINDIYDTKYIDEIIKEIDEEDSE